MTRTFIGNIIIVCAVRDIPTGRKIFIGYISLYKLFTEQYKRLKDGYKFECDYNLYYIEAKVYKITVEKYIRFYKKINSFLSINSLNNSNFWTIPATKKAKVKKLLEEIREIYFKVYFKRFPQLDYNDIDF